MNQTDTPMTDAIVGPASKFGEDREESLMRRLERDRAALIEAHEQIERLSREADNSCVNVRAMLGDIARTTLARVRS